jgi:peptidoglycan/xylan/chitin deacetylase (PgdA/CDA1 family)
MPLKYQRGNTLAVALGADFDAQCLWMEEKKPSPGTLSRGEFGAEVGLPRLLDLFHRYEIKATFFIPTHTLLTFPGQIEAIQKEGHEIGAHGVYHEQILTLGSPRERELMELQIEQHLRVLGRKPRGYRSPSWDFSDVTLSLLEEFNFDWDSSLMGRDFEPYHPKPVEIDYENGNKFGAASRILEFPVSWYLDDFPFLELCPDYGLPGATSAQMLFERWKDAFDYALEHVPNGIYILTVHPQTIGRAQNLMMFEQLVRYIDEHEKIWFASLSDIFDCWYET